MRTATTAAGAIGSELRALAAERRGTSPFELVCSMSSLCVWHDGCLWHASFEEVPRKVGELNKAWLIRADATALKESGGYRRGSPGVVDLVAADTAELFVAVIHALSERTR